jgi:hypothetical protein
MGLVGGERVERAGHPDGTPCTDRLGGRLPPPPGRHPLAIRRKEQRTPEVPARGVTPPGPRPGPAIPGPLQALSRALPDVWWWSTPPARRTSGRPGHANLSGPCASASQPGSKPYLSRMYRLMCRFLSRSDSVTRRIQGRPARSRLPRSQPGDCPTAASRSLLGRQPPACPARSAAYCAGMRPAQLQVLPGQRLQPRRAGHGRSARG